MRRIFLFAAPYLLPHVCQACWAVQSFVPAKGFRTEQSYPKTCPIQVFWGVELVIRVWCQRPALSLFLPQWDAWCCQCSHPICWELQARLTLCLAAGGWPSGAGQLAGLEDSLGPLLQPDALVYRILGRVLWTGGQNSVHKLNPCSQHGSPVLRKEMITAWCQSGLCLAC